MYRSAETAVESRRSRQILFHGTVLVPKAGVDNILTSKHGDTRQYFLSRVVFTLGALFSTIIGVMYDLNLDLPQACFESRL